MRSKLFLYMLFCCLATSWLYAQSESWQEDADALILMDQQKFEIESLEKARYKVRQVIRFNNNKEVDDFARVVVEESNLAKCLGISAKIRDKNGKVVKHLKKKSEFESAQFSPGYELYSESKYYWAELDWLEYPFEIEYEYELELKTLFLWPPWYPQSGIPVQKSTYQLILPNEEFNFNTHSIGLEIEPVKRQSKKGKVEWFWELSEVDPPEKEGYMSPESRNQQRALLFVAETFMLGKYAGQSDTWDNFAKWYRRLITDETTLPPAMVAEVKELLSDEQTVYEKVNEIYRYLQDNTRYVAIYLDIGGWKPHSLSSVAFNKYGDCKDLTMLMIAMLDIAGIQSYPALMRTRDTGRVIEEFPSNQFNHVLTCVPSESDTIWVECTADNCYAGDLDYSREDSKVLLVKENGGEIVYIPPSPAEENGMVSKIKGRLTSDGLLYLDGWAESSGNQADYVRGNLIGAREEDQVEWVRNYVGENLPKVDLSSYQTYNIEEKFNQPVKIEFSGKASNFAASSGSRLFVNPAIMNRRSKRSVPRKESREFDIYFKYAYADTDSVELQIPTGYALEAGPKVQNLETDFGRYEVNYEAEGNQFRYRRIFQITDKIIAREKYDEFKKFLKAVSKSDGSKFVFKKGG